MNEKQGMEPDNSSDVTLEATLDIVKKGRCISVHRDEHRIFAALLRDENDVHRVDITGGDVFSVGDILEVTNGEAKILTPNRHPERETRFLKHILDPRRLTGVGVREIVEGSIREFFKAQGFRETRTPTLVVSPGMEPHIRPMEVKGHFRKDQPVYLQTSPEFAMKKLLAGGLEKIFQICPSYRNEYFSNTHHPEFTMLEWYRAYAGYEEIMEDVEEMMISVCEIFTGIDRFTYQGNEISLEAPWPRLTVRELFKKHVSIDLTVNSEVAQLAAHCRRLGHFVSDDDTWDDLYFKIWMNEIEPNLPKDRAVFVVDYPPSQAALANLKTDSFGNSWAKRFEVYIGGLELGNAFDELTDPKIQKERFEKDMELRRKIYGPQFPKSPIDPEFIEALEEGIPPSGGIAMGIDRIVMLFADETDINYTQWIPSHWPDANPIED